MRRFYVLASCALIAAFTTLFFASKSAAQSSDEIQKYIEEWRIEHQVSIELIQEDFYKTHGYYWQGIATHSEATKPEYEIADKTTPIEDEKSFQADCLDCKPTDRLADPSWSELFPSIVDKLPAELRIDVYSGPEGQGYVISLSYCVDKSCYGKSINVGPEAWRNTEWMEQVDPEAVIE